MNVTSYLCTQRQLCPHCRKQGQVSVNILNKQRQVERRLGRLIDLLKSAAESGHHPLSPNPYNVDSVYSVYNVDSSLRVWKAPFSSFYVF